MYVFQLRAAELADLDAIYGINQKVLGANMPYAALKSVFGDILMDSEQTVYVISNSGHITGYIHAALVHNFIEEVYTEIVSMGSYEYYRGKGGGTLLLNTVCKWSVQMFSRRIKAFPEGCSDRCNYGDFFVKNGFCRNSCGVFEKNLDLKGNYDYERVYT